MFKKELFETKSYLEKLSKPTMLVVLKISICQEKSTNDEKEFGHENKPLFTQYQNWFRLLRENGLLGNHFLIQNEL